MMKQPIRVLHVIDTAGPGGAETVFANLVANLPVTRWDSTPVIPQKDWLHQALRERGIIPVLLSDDENDPSRLKTFRRIRALVRLHDVELVHAHLLGASVYATLAVIPKGIPVISTFHGHPDIDPDHWLTPVKLRLILRGRNRMVFVSRALRDAVLPPNVRALDRVRVIYNGTIFRQPTRSVYERERLGVSSREFLVGAVGNIRPAKDYATLLKAAAILRNVGCPIRVVIAGEGSGALRKQLVTLRSSLDLEQEVRFLGFRSDIPQLLGCLDAFVLTSMTEGFSLSTVEALAAGIPVVATKCGGPEEIIQDRSTGVLVPPSSAEAVATALLAFYRDPSWAQSLGASGQADVRARFSMDRMVSAYEKLYTEALTELS